MISRTSSDLRGWKQGILAAVAAVLLAACQQQHETESERSETAMDWARDALERNPNLELIATDVNAQVFTVRDKQTSEVRAVKLTELAAGPVASLAANNAQPHVPAATPSTAESSRPPAAEQAAGAAEPPQEAATAATAEQATPASTATNTNEPAYTIERTDGQVRVSGPGVSIVSSGSGTSKDASAAQQTAVEPIICEGQRMMHLDNRQIYVEGDAITVRGGCEMHITNSRIVATGTGIIVQDGIIHVSNSHIEGADNSFDADSRAKVFVRASTFKGLPQRSELALVQDQGGNRWR